MRCGLFSIGSINQQMQISILICQSVKTNKKHLARNSNRQDEQHTEEVNHFEHAVAI